MKIFLHKILNVFFFAILLFAFGCMEQSTTSQKANIHTVENLDILKNEIDNLDENSLVVFDVDETLITPVDKFFHIKSWWQELLLRIYYVWNIWDFKFGEKFVWYYNHALFNCKWQLIDKSAPQLIKELQKKGVKVIALTGCITGEHGNIKAVEDWRIKQLKKFDIDFGISFPEKNYFVLDKDFEKPFPVFKNGIIFANICPRSSSRTKAPVLVEFLEKMNLKPNKIIFVDDGLRYLEETAEEVKRLDIPFIGLHYVASKKFLTDVDMRVARCQVRTLIKDKRWIGDEEKKKAIVIGATSGMGRAIAKQLSAHNYDVGIIGRRLSLLKSLQKELKTKSYIKQIDVTEKFATNKLSELINEMGGLDLMVVSISAAADIERNRKDYKSIMKVDLKGFWEMSEEAVKLFKKQKHGHLVGISSTSGLRGNASNPTYSGAKAFISTYLEGVRNYMVQNKIPACVTDICPGWVDIEDANVYEMQGAYWIAPMEKAATQIYDAIETKKKKAYITKRWGLVALLLKVLPDCIYNADWWKIR